MWAASAHDSANVGPGEGVEVGLDYRSVVDLLRTSWRNVWRNPRRSGVTIAAMTLALYVLLLYAGFVAGMIRDMEANIVELEMGDAQIMPAGYRDDPDLYTRIASSQRVVEPLLAEGFRASPRILAWGLVAADESSAGVQFRGIDVTADATVSRIHEHTMSGTWLDPAVPQGVVIGRRLSRMLGVEVGSELVVVTQGLDGAMAYDLVNVQGILNSVGDATDKAGVFVLADTLRTLIGIDQGVHQIVVRRPEGRELDAAASDIRRVAPDLDVQTWRELNPTLSSMLDSATQAIGAMYVIIYLAVAILILNAMLMASYERIREIGVLKALGVGPGQIFGLITIEAGLQAVVAIGIGLALGVPSLWWLAEKGIDMGTLGGISMMGIALQPIMYAEVGPGTFTGPVGTLVVMTFLAALVPAIKAARIDPVEALHHQ